MSEYDKTRLFQLLCGVNQRELTAHEAFELKGLKRKAGRKEVKTRKAGARRAVQWGFVGS